MARFLILGASGLIGRRLLDALGPAQAVGTYAAHPFPGGLRFDMAADSLDALLDGGQGVFSHAVILGANANIDACARDPAGTAALNVAGAIRAIDAAIARDIVPIFASSDGVYDGSHGLWRETQAVQPILTYGRQKHAVEQALAERRAPWIALRIAKVLDPDSGRDAILAGWCDALRQGRLIRCATDQRFSPVGIADVVQAIRRLAETGTTGLFNLGSGETVTRIGLLETLIDALSQREPIDPRIECCSLRDFTFAEARPLDTSMSIDRLAAAIGFAPEGLAAICARAATVKTVR